MADSTSLWWLVLVFGAAVPIALMVQPRGSVRLCAPELSVRPGDKERELLDVLGHHEEVGPVLVATETTLAVTEAEGMLGDLSRKGHLEVRVRDGVLAYARPR